MKPESDLIQKELEAIRKANHGMISPEKVVEFASNPDTALHGKFTWDNGKAAHEYRLWQARTLIRVQVAYLPQSPGVPVRAFVSLSTERNSKTGGYRPIQFVLKTKPLREQMLIDALAELEAIRRKYSTLKALAPVFAAMDNVIALSSAKAKPRVKGDVVPASPPA